MSEENQTSLADLYAQLREPLPAEAVEVDNSRGFQLTGIKGAYVIERLNNVFGLCGVGWRFEIAELEVADGWATCTLHLSYRYNGEWSKPIPSAGDQRLVKNRAGDAMKGAITDALKKAASYLGVGEAAYKGLLTEALTNKRPTPSPSPNTTHWIDRPEARKAFWAWAKGTLKLTEAEVYQALGVEHIHDFAGNMNQAKHILEAAANIDEIQY